MSVTHGSEQNWAVREGSRIGAASNKGSVSDQGLANRAIGGLLTPQGVLALQRLAGNGAVTGLITAQRHSSFEHSLMSNSRADQLDAHSEQQDMENRRHLLEAERDRTAYLGRDPYRVPSPDEYPFEGVQLIRLKKSGIYVTDGEITALADYLPSGEEINNLDAKRLLKILQYMRSEINMNCSQLLRTTNLRKAKTNSAETVEARRNFPGAQSEEGMHPVLDQSDTARKVLIEEQATAQEGSQSYTGLLTRNACHFAPFSWERYTDHHNRAAALARQAFLRGDSAASEKNLTAKAKSSEEQADLRTQARVDGAYADHFLQDSFAAGHLINKTMVIQWFLEWAEATGQLGGIGNWGLPDDTLHMTVAEQPKIGGEALYGQMAATGSVLDRSGKPVAVDPQTASEMKGTWQDRAKAVGLDTQKGNAKETAHKYWDMLRWAALNYVAGHVHDLYNDEGLTVKNRHGDEMHVGGDASQFQEAGYKGMRVPIEATNKSHKAIEDTLDTGEPSATAEDCLALVPIKVMVNKHEVPLLEWNENQLRERCITEIFPAIVDSTEFKEVRDLLSNQVDRRPSKDWTDTLPDMSETRPLPIHRH